MTDRPGTDEYAPYYETYVRLVPDGPIATTLADQTGPAVDFYRRLSERQAQFRYAAGKWTLKQLLGHVCDAERMFACRALAFSRGEPQALPGFDQDVYVTGANSDARTWVSLIDELVAVRAATSCLFESMDETMLGRRGVASGKDVSVRALGFIIAGHDRHHRDVARARYLEGPDFPAAE